MRKQFLATATLALALGTTVAVTPATAQPQGPDTARAAAGSDLRIGTYNIRAGVALDDFKRVVDEFKPHAEVIGLQEIGSNDRNKYLVADHDWGYFRPRELQQNPVIWRRDLFDFIGADGVKIADARDLHGEHTGDEAKGDSYATVVRLHDRESDEKLSFINVHLVRGAVKGGRPAPGKPNLFKLYTDQVAGLIRAVKAERSALDGAGNKLFDRVYVMGDFNVGFEADQKWHLRKLPYRKFKKIGYRSMWQNSPFLHKSYGTHRDALIDQVWNNEDSASEEIHREIQASDHSPAVAVYTMPAPDPGYQPTDGTVGFGQTKLVPNGNQPGDTENDGPSKLPSIFVPLVGELRYGYVKVEVVEGSAKLSPDGNGPGDFAIDISSLFDNDFTNNQIAIDIVGDEKVEGDETFTLRLVDPVNTRVDPNADTIEITIHDDRNG